MNAGRGYWLDAKNGALYRVTTHNDWLLNLRNQEKVRLTPKQVEVLGFLDPVKEIDEIRMVGVMAGLVRLRDYRNRLSVQFYAPESEVNAVLQAIVREIPEVTDDNSPFLTIQNLWDDSVARLPFEELTKKLYAREAILQPPRDPILYNQTLRQKMQRLLGEQPR